MCDDFTSSWPMLMNCHRLRARVRPDAYGELVLLISLQPAGEEQQIVAGQSLTNGTYHPRSAEMFWPE